MKKVLLASLLMAVSAGVVAQERSRMKVLEDGREYRGGSLLLPASEGGVLEIKGCAACSLKLEPGASLFIGKNRVQLAEMRSYLNSNPRIAVLVVSPINTRVVSRIVAVASSPQ